MATVYVREQGAVVRKRGERLAITKSGDTLEEVLMIHVDQLVVVGNVQLTTPAVAQLLKHNVDVVFLTRYYKFRGRLVQTGSRFAQLRHTQLQKMSHAPACLAIARAVVIGKLTNQRTVLQRQAATMVDGEARRQIRAAISGIGRMIEAAPKADTVDVLRGYEGKAGADYFGAFRVLFPQELGFKGRAYHPPPDPANALLSFGYALLLKDLTAAVQLVGLDPYLGFFHAIDYGRPSLVLDVMEEFRPIIVDPMVLEIVNRRMLTKDDFTWTGNSKRPVRLSDAGCEVVLREYEKRIHAEVYHPLVEQNTTYRRCFELQVRQLARVVLGKTAEYQPMTIR